MSECFKNVNLVNLIDKVVQVFPVEKKNNFFYQLLSELKLLTAAIAHLRAGVRFKSICQIVLNWQPKVDYVVW